MASSAVKKYLSIALKIIVFLVLLYVIYWQIKARSENVNLYDAFVNDFEWKRFPYLLIAIFLMPLNWVFESIKWKTFISRIQKNFTLKLSLKSVLCGTMFGFITPNRIGEFGGRLYGVERGGRTKSITAGYWGGAAQFFVTFSIGALMGWETLVQQLELQKYGAFVIPALIALAIFVLVIFFKFERFIATIQRFPGIKRLTKKYTFDFDMPFNSLLLVLGLTITRYLIYVTQYIMVLYFFGLDLDFFILFTAVTTMLLVHTTVPSLPFLDLVVKGILVLLLAPYTNSELGIILAIFAIWLINIVTPAMVGYFIFVQFKSLKQEEVQPA